MDRSLGFPSGFDVITVSAAKKQIVPIEHEVAISSVWNEMLDVNASWSPLLAEIAFVFEIILQL